MTRRLEVSSVTKTYRHRQVVRGISLHAQSGEVVGLLGPNGAGKTTTFYMIVGLVKPDEGQVVLDGKPIGNLPMYERARLGIGYLPQEPSVFGRLTVLENLLVVMEILGLGRPEGLERSRRMLEEFHLSHLAESKGYQLSGGERRRVEIARALAVGPSFLLLDEPFAGIDPITIGDLKGVIGYLKEKGLGVIITDHNVRDTLSITDRAYIINGGQVLDAGPPDSLVNNPEVQRTYLGEGFTI
ncbi:MAG: LPS export ABC transporter ATP-binding protein [Thermodesulfobacteriota bacterium]